jgi:putative transcriptional regulator
MSKAYTEISEALHDAIAHSKGQDVGVVEHKPAMIDVKAIRAKTGMSQQLFSATFGISIGTLRHWEQGARLPKGPARVLLQVVDRNPRAVIEAISDQNITRR